MSGDVRADFTDYIRAQVFGPFLGEDEVTQGDPLKQYLAGVLYPREASSDSVLDDEIQDSLKGSIGEELADDPITMASQWMPSSVGVTFALEESHAISVEVWGGSYSAVEGRTWQRTALATQSDPDVHVFPCPEDAQAVVRQPALGGRAEVHVRWRKYGSAWLVTVSLVNFARQESGSKPNASACLFQVGLRCQPDTGTLREYPALETLAVEEEEAELRLLYRDRRTFAIGHGAAATWDTDGEPPRWVSADFLPQFEVPPTVGLASDELPALAMHRLADPSFPAAQILQDLAHFAGAYEEWLKGLEDGLDHIPALYREVGEVIVGRVRTALSRMRRGIEALDAAPDVLDAFRLANLAMLMQRRHVLPDLGGTARDRDSIKLETIDYLRYEGARWRPFQLAFVLLVLDSLANDDSTDRETVDLLWFPTGGGKTEAYLLLVAFETFLRRMRYGDRGAGTAVITRYTLRLLTSQQFQRAATLACSCELIRQVDPEKLGARPIGIGLWIGSGSVPNRYADALELVQEMREEARPVNRFQLERCPWCGTKLVPDAGTSQDEDYGIRASATSFEFYCPTSSCSFHSRLPVQVVDEALYDCPPTILIATVDKFARMAWEERAGELLGGERFLPPTLVLQDELHLLSGPLGTMAGLYESAIETLIELKGSVPKVIASTATIRQAGHQVRALFGRDVAVFPPPGLTADDSFYARTDRTRPGRRYVGLMSPAHTVKTSLVHVAAAILQAPIELELTGNELDGYWTLVMYHNSLRELGGMLTMAKDDVDSRIRVIAPSEEKARRIPYDEVVELTGNLPGYEIPRVLDRMFEPAESGRAVSVLLATNMLSVGVDVPRLALMLVDGQPKATSEYIQATSRVGRAEVPGLVFIHYNSSKPRDRSHYEAFRGYHSALYRYVEPTSVTPFSLPARGRALHAALVILVRHGLGLAANDQAGGISRVLPQTEEALSRFLSRVGRVEEAELSATREHLDRLVHEWLDAARECADARRPLYYSVRSKRNLRGLLRRFDDVGEGWRTLDSMRNVDQECRVDLMGERQ